jgi:hypothetical protein
LLFTYHNQLLNQFLLQAGVAASCTALAQVYDIGFAAQSNAKVKAEKDRLRRRIREKAELEGVQPRYVVTEKEILELAIAHHEEAVRQNEVNNAVLRAGRQGGWLSYRPNLEGKLVSCDKQKWARSLNEGTDRMPKNVFFKDRGKWIVQGVVQDLSEEAAAEARKTAFQPLSFEEHEKEAAGVVLYYSQPSDNN